MGFQLTPLTSSSTHTANAGQPKTIVHFAALQPGDRPQTAAGTRGSSVLASQSGKRVSPSLYNPPLAKKLLASLKRIFKIFLPAGKNPLGGHE